MKTPYTPKVGHLVISQDHSGTYKVLKLDTGGMVEVRIFLIGKQQLIGPVTRVPRSRLKPFKEDASQAAARIVKEATED
jgi:hypothetical protein